MKRYPEGARGTTISQFKDLREPVGEPQLHARVQRHTVEQRIEHTHYVQILDAPVPQKVEQLVDFFKDLDSHVPVQVIEVPKILPEDVPMRAVLRATQLAEQLVEVPTIISYASLSLSQALLEYRQRTVEQDVDIPAVGGSGTGEGLLGLLPGQSSTAFGGARIPAATAEQIVDTPVPHGRRDLPSAASSSGLPGTANQGVFRTSPQRKKSATRPPHLRSELPPHSSPSTPAAQLESQEEAEAESPEDVLWASTLEERFPDVWAPYSAPDGRTHFRHRSGRWW